MLRFDTGELVDAHLVDDAKMAALADADPTRRIGDLLASGEASRPLPLAPKQGSPPAAPLPPPGDASSSPSTTSKWACWEAVWRRHGSARRADHEQVGQDLPFVVVTRPSCWSTAWSAVPPSLEVAIRFRARRMRRRRRRGCRRRHARLARLDVRGARSRAGHLGGPAVGDVARHVGFVTRAKGGPAAWSGVMAPGHDLTPGRRGTAEGAGPAPRSSVARCAPTARRRRTSAGGPAGRWRPAVRYRPAASSA